MEAHDAPSKSSHPTPLRIFYAVGPGDAAAYFRSRRDGVAPAFHTAIAFSDQFFQTFEKEGHQLYVISWCSRAETLTLGPHAIENLPRHPSYFRGGLQHHLGVVRYGFSILRRALRFRAQVVLIDSGTTHWIVLALFAIFRIPVIAVMFNALWAADYRPKRGVHRLISITDGWFFRYFAAATLPMSPEIERQIVAVAGHPKGPQFQFAPLYRKEFFDRIPAPPPQPQQPFNVLYLGRVERYKGVFDMLTMAETLDKESPGGYSWKIVGAGGDFEDLKADVLRRNLSHLVSVEPNMVNEDVAVATLGWAHVNIVPTRHEFKEGLAMTAVEGVLAGRPVVLTAVVPAWEVLPGAIVKVDTDDVVGLTDAIRELAHNQGLYNQLSAATTALQPTYYDPDEGLAGSLLRAMKAIGRA
jgi:glycosyltransferase involved in cell wall biosynthesis